MRILLLSCLLFLAAGTCSCQVPYSVLRMNGDTLTGKEHFIRGDTLGLPGGVRVALRDIVLFWTPKERWTFTYPGGQRERIKQLMTDSCAHARVARVRNEYRLTPFDSLPIPSTWRADTLIRSCYEDWLGRRLDMLEEEEAKEEARTRYRIMDGHGGVAIGEPNQIILLNGDTLVQKKDLYSKDGLLCWIGGGCIPEPDVLLVRTVKGQFYYHPDHKHKVRLKWPIPDMSPGSQGRLHANRLFASCLEWEQADLPLLMRTDTVFLAAYREEVTRLVVDAERIRNRANAMGMVSGAWSGGIQGGPIGMVVGILVSGAVPIPPEKRPYYGTPMPPE